MAAVDVVQNDGFYFTWTIQNFSYYAGDSVTSPAFVPIENSSKQWCLIMYPKRMGGSHTIELKLKLLSNLNSKYERLEASFELSICTSTGIFKHEGSQTKAFMVSKEYGINSTILPRDLHKKEYGVNIENDSLTVRCKILNVINKNVVNGLHLVVKQSVIFGQFYARTIIVKERGLYAWNIPNFLDDFNKKRPKHYPVIVLEKSSFTMEITSRGGGFAEENILIEIKPVDSSRLFYTWEMSLLGIDGKKVYSVRDEHMFDLSENELVWKLSFIPMKKLLSHKEQYLPNGTLNLRCEFAVSSGAKYLVNHNEFDIDHYSLSEYCKQEKNSDVPSSLNENLERFYAEGKFSDLTIRALNKDYSVHKPILCARSEVFSAMFESDTKEKLTGVIEIEDIDDDTISKMLLFMYTDSIGEELVFETASKLYFAADKYGIVALKEKCADFLKCNFTMANVCDVLVLADMHQDQELKSIAQKYILENCGEIIDSEEWKKLMQSNLQLASEIMQSIIRNLKV